MAVQLKIAGSSTETGELLRQYLEARGMTVSPKAGPVVCYGVSTRGEVSLNSACGLNKIERLKLMNDAGISTVPWFSGKVIPPGFKFPALARKEMGHGGTDIVPVFQPDEVSWRVAAGWDWFSSYIPIDKELRVWVFRDKHLGTYQKEMQRPSEFKHIGRNFRNGFEFIHTKVNYTAAVHEARGAIKAIGLDFAAVDLLIGQDQNIYILEVNTAPGVIRSKAEATLGLLADEIVNWERSEYLPWQK